MVLTAGDINDSTPFSRGLAGIRERQRGRDRPWTCPARVLADKGHSSRANHVSVDLVRKLEQGTRSTASVTSLHALALAR